MTQDRNQPEFELIDLALHLFNIPKPEKLHKRPKHLLDLVMKALFEYPQLDDQTKIEVDQYNTENEKLLKEGKTASEMKSYGVKFEAVESDILNKIDFSNGILKIPKICVEESTEDVFWNFLIYEMSTSASRVFASYILLMDTLITNQKDVEVLLEAKIIVSRINDKELLVSLFNDLYLSAMVNPKDFQFAPILKKVNQFCESTYHPVRGYFMKKYYDNRWEVLSNIILFFFTVTQTIFSVLTYNPKSNTT